MVESWNQIKTEVIKETRKIIGPYITHEVGDLVQLFKDFLYFPLPDESLKLDGLESRVMNALKKIFVEGLPKTDNHTYFLDLARVEPFLRKLLYLLDESRLRTLTADRKGLYAFLSELGLLPSNIDPQSIDPKAFQNDTDLKDHILTVYQLRNIESHVCSEWTNAEMHSNIASVLGVYLFILDRNYEKVHQVIDPYFLHQQKDFTKYLESLKLMFEDKVGRFIHIRGTEDFKLFSSAAIEVTNPLIKDLVRVERKGALNHLRLNSLPEKRMLVWGDAGMGKTTSIEYMAYEDAKSRLANENSPIPVYLSLGLLTDKAISIRQSIYNRLEVDAELGESLLKSGKLNLFLDGINEIPKDENFSLRTIRHKEIQSLLDNYENTLIILSNRPQEVNEFQNIPVFALQKMEEEQVIEFIAVYNIGQPELTQVIIKAVRSDQRLLRIVKTPLMLSRFIEIIRRDGEIPRSEGKIIEQFIKSLYKREKEEKKDANFDIRKIHYLLSFLGYVSLEKNGTNSGMTDNEVLNNFVLCSQKYGFSIDTIYVLEISTQLNILEKSDGLYTFSHQAYQDYYHSQYEQSLVSL